MRSRENMIYSRGLKVAIGIVGIIILFIALAEKPCRSGELSVTGETSRNQIIGEKDHKVVVFYFHGTFRCLSCMRLEQLTLTAIEEKYEKEMENGLLEVKITNVDEPDNKHYIKDYGLYTKSVIVSDVLNGKEVRWKNLTKVWELLRKEEAFKAYIQAEVGTYLQG
jgi:hypothetical protein